jgi:hypothetical protein
VPTRCRKACVAILVRDASGDQPGASRAKNSASARASVAEISALSSCRRWVAPGTTRDIVQFQQIAGSFAPAPPVAGVGPGALADPTPFLDQLAKEGMEAHVETASLGFDFPDFASAWDVLAGVTAAQLPTAKQQAARSAVLAAMWPDGDGPRYFRNLTQFIMGQRR